MSFLYFASVMARSIKLISSSMISSRLEWMLGFGVVLSVIAMVVILFSFAAF